jgi:hypothetical protein
MLFASCPRSGAWPWARGAGGGGYAASRSCRERASPPPDVRCRRHIPRRPRPAPTARRRRLLAHGAGASNFEDSFDVGFTIFVEQRDAPPTAGTALYFSVDDVDALHAQWSARGVAFAHPPQKVFWGYGAELVDPDGYRIRLWDEKTMRENA